jgi:hypothetical protein
MKSAAKPSPRVMFAQDPYTPWNEFIITPAARKHKVEVMDFGAVERWK